MVIKKAYKHGLTLVEAAMVLAIATLVVSAIMVFVNSSSNSNRSQEVMKYVFSLQGDILNMYAHHPTFDGLSNASVINAGLVPYKMVGNSTTAIKNAFKGELNITIESVGSPNNAFGIEATNLPSEGCTKIATFDYGKRLQYFEIGGSRVPNPTTIADVMAACELNNGEVTTIKWVFSKF